MRNPDGLGFGDWDFVLDKFEALRRTILIWGQFPWWNPWSRGGFPLAAEPQIGAVSMATPLVLALGHDDRPADLGDPLPADRRRGDLPTGLALVSRALGGGGRGLIYGLNGAVVHRRRPGVRPADELLQRPLAGLLRLPDRPAVLRRALAGLLDGLRGDERHPVHESLRRSPDGLDLGPRTPGPAAEGGAGPCSLHTLAAVGVFLLICGWRLSTVLLVMLDDKRERVTYWDESPSAMLHYLLYRPGPNWTDDFNAAARLDVRRAVLLCRSGRPRAGPAQPGLGLAMVAHADARLLLAGDRLGEVVSAELLARWTGRSSARPTW